MKPVLAVLTVWVALVAPSQPARLTPDVFIRLPLEGLLIVGLALVLPRSTGRLLPWVVGPALGALFAVKLLDFGFFTAFDRPFKPVDDSGYLGIGIETLRNGVGPSSADLIVAICHMIGVRSHAPSSLPGSPSPLAGEGRGEGASASSAPSA